MASAPNGWIFVPSFNGTWGASQSNTPTNTLSYWLGPNGESSPASAYDIPSVHQPVLSDYIAPNVNTPAQTIATMDQANISNIGDISQNPLPQGSAFDMSGGNYAYAGAGSAGSLSPITDGPALTDASYQAPWSGSDAATFSAFDNQGVANYGVSSDSTAPAGSGTDIVSAINSQTTGENKATAAAANTQAQATVSAAKTVSATNTSIATNVENWFSNLFVRFGWILLGFLFVGGALYMVTQKHFIERMEPA